MNDSVTGRAIGTDTVAAQKDVADKFWFDWRALLPTLPPDQQAMVLSWLSLQLAQAAGNGIITHVPGWDLIDFDPSTGTHQDPASDALSFNRPPPALAQQVAGSNFVTLWLKVGDGENDWAAIAGAGASDHKVKRDADATPVYGDELLVSPNGSIGQLNDPESDSIDIQVVCASDLPLPDAPVASAGDPNDQPASIKHVHPLVPSDTYGGKLYTALVPDPLALPSVDAVFHEQGGCDPKVFGTMWTEIASGVWRRNVAGHILGGLTDDISAWVGMRVFAWSGAFEQNHTGPYVLDDIGENPITHADTYPQMHRAPDFASTAQVLHGTWFAVLGGTAWGPTPQTPPAPPLVHAFRLTNADPVGEIDVALLTWEFIDAPSPTPTNELLTAAQLSLASPDTVEVDRDVSSGSGEVELVVCTEHDAAMAGTTLPGDKPWRFHLLCGVAGSDDPAATTVIRCYLRGSNDPAWHLVATTQPLHNTTYAMWVEAGMLGADYAMAAGELLQARFTAVSDSTIGVTVGLVFNDSEHHTYIETPMTIGNNGTDDHNLLKPSSRFRLSNPTLPFQHDSKAIKFGRVHSPWRDYITTTDGVFTMPNSNTAVLLGTEDLIGIDLEADGPDPWQHGDIIWLGIAQARKVVAGGSPPSGCAPIYIGITNEPQIPQSAFQLAAGAIIALMCTGTYWAIATQPAFGG